MIFPRRKTDTAQPQEKVLVVCLTFVAGSLRPAPLWKPEVPYKLWQGFWHSGLLTVQMKSPGMTSPVELEGLEQQTEQSRRSENRGISISINRRHVTDQLPLSLSRAITDDTRFQRSANDS